jgi:hypothetical protein
VAGEALDQAKERHYGQTLRGEHDAAHAVFCSVSRRPNNEGSAPTIR